MSRPAAAEDAPPEKPKRKTRRIGRERPLLKRVEAKPDGRYLIYYMPE